MNQFLFELYINGNGKKKKIEKKIMLQKFFLNVSFSVRDRAHGNEKVSSKFPVPQVFTVEC